MSASGIEFLAVDDVLRMHRRQLARFGGSDGLRDRGLLESAVAQAQASFGGTYVHDDLFAMASAYLFHIVKNHPFVDGNKRAGLLAATVFLRWNLVSLQTNSREVCALTLGVAEGSIGKAEVAARLREFAERA
jgi:death-on-curing protein